MPTWPEDHPGRDCEKCGLCLYPFWIDDTPPPGTCIEGADDARLCVEARTRLAQGVAVARAQDKEPHPRTLASIRKAGLTGEEIDAEIALGGRVNDAEFALSFGLAPAPLPWREPFLEWIREDPEARTLAALRVMLGSVEWADGELTIAQLYDLAALYASRLRRVADTVEHRDYEPEGDDD